MSAQLKPLNILVYSAQMEPLGGIESHVMEFCLRMAGAGNAVTLVSSRYLLDAATDCRLRRSGLRVLANTSAVLMQSPLGKWLWTVWTLGRLWPGKFDVVYTNGQGRNVALVLRWFRGRVRRVHHHHTSCDATDIATWPPAYRRAMRSAEALVVCASYIRPRMAAALGIDHARVIYCFSRAFERARRVAVSPTVCFGYFGRLIPEKGVAMIFRLSEDKRLADVQWKVWGSGAQFGPKEFARFPRVRYEGVFSDSAGLERALSAIDCYCLFSSHPEGLPISLMEVMSAGKPWISTPQGGIPEMAHDASLCMLVDLSNYEEIVAACLAMQQRIQGGLLKEDRQLAYYRENFAAQVLVGKWMGVLTNG